MVTGFLETYLKACDHNLRLFFEHLKPIQGITVVAKSPGSLGSNLNADDKDHVFGSLSIKIPVHNVSLLLFSNGKLKVSGGFGEHGEDNYVQSLNKDAFEEWLWVNKIEPTFRVMNLPLFRNEVKINVNLLNGLFKSNKIERDRYVLLCNHIQDQHFYPRVEIPSAYSKNKEHKRGRIVAMKLYVNKTNKCSIHFDYSGNIQLFAFQSPIEMLEQAQLFKERVDSFK